LARPTGVGRASATYEIPIEGRDEWLAGGEAAGMRDGYLRGALPTNRTARQVAAFVAEGGSVAEAAVRLGTRPGTAKRHLADLRVRSDLTTEQLVYRGRAEGWLVVPSLESA